MFYRMRLFYRIIFLQSEFFLTELNFFKGMQIFILNKKLFLKKKKKKILLKSCKFSSSKYNLFLLSFATFEQPYMFL